MFISHVNNAVAYGLKYGVYYYAHASNIQQAQEEANWVNDKVITYLAGQNPELGIWYDAEDSLMTSGDVTAVCSKFVSHLNSMGYTYVGIYSSYNWLTSGVIKPEALASYVPYWVAQYYKENSLAIEKPYMNIKLWQKTDSHYIGGRGYDGNVYYGL